MKKLISILLVASLLTGCGTEIKLKEVEQTNESLTIFLDPIDIAMKLAIPKYKAEYPDVEVEVIQTTNIYEQRTADYNALLASLMAGEGPDVMSTDLFRKFVNIEKSVSEGLFADMSEFYDNDDDPVPNLNKRIMDGGVFDGKRYLFPFNYNISVQLSTEETLKANGFEKENCVDYLSFLLECEKVVKKGNASVFPTKLEPTNIINKCGYNPINIENNSINLDFPEFKATMEFAKTLYNVQSVEEKILQDRYSVSDEDYVKYIAKNELILLSIDPYLVDTPFLHFLGWSRQLPLLGLTPALVPIRNADGGITADIQSAAFVRSSSPNKQNAYNFIKILRSEEIQSDLSTFYSDITTNDKAMENLYDFQAKGSISTMSGTGVLLEGIDRELYDEYMSYVDEVTVVRWDRWEVQIQDLMLPYFTGEKSFEECVDDAKWDIEFRLSE